MKISHSARLLAATALAGISFAGPARAQAASDADARIRALEAQVSELKRMVNELRNLPGTQTPAASAASGGSQIASSTPKADASPGSSSPDTPRAVTSGEPGASKSGASFNGKPTIQSADGRFVANLHGVLQFDAANYFQPGAGPITSDFRRGGAPGENSRGRNLASGTNIRRGRIGIDGKVFNDIEYNFLYDFGGAGVEDAGHIQEAWLQYSGLKPFHLKVGVTRPSLGLEDQGSTNGMLFLERPTSTDLQASIAGADFRESAQLYLAQKRLYAMVGLTSRLVGVINTTGSGVTQPYNQSINGVARLAFLPVLGEDYLVHTGVHGSRAFSVSDTGGPDGTGTRFPVDLRERAELRVDGTRLIDTGGINGRHANTAGAEVAAQKQQFLVQAEYEYMQVERRDGLANPDFYGWYVEGAWTLTGERRKFNTGTYAFDAPPVKHPFDLRQGHYGAFELAARFSESNLNYHKGQYGRAASAEGIRGGDQKIYTLGLNWYLNPIVRFMFDYQHVDIQRLSPNATTFLTPVGAEIGQKYDVVSLRSQLAF